MSSSLADFNRHWLEHDDAFTDAVTNAVAEPAKRVDVEKLRDAAVRNAEVLRIQAVAVYNDLVARGVGAWRG